jgi:hypothetical protein
VVLTIVVIPLVIGGQLDNTLWVDLIRYGGAGLTWLAVTAYEIGQSKGARDQRERRSQDADT